MTQRKPRKTSTDDSKASPTRETADEGYQLAVSSGKPTRVTISLDPDAAVEVIILKKKTNGTITLGKKISSSNTERHSPVFKPNLKFDRINWTVVLICAALLVYLLSRFIALDLFPIYFFSDEAVQTVRANELMKGDMFGEGDEFMPTYLINGGQYNLGTSVYLQMIPSLIFCDSIWATRGICVLFSLLAVLGVGLAAKNVFKSPQPYLYILLLSVIPAWFIHSRTAFETALAASFYSAFLYCYMMYREGKIGYLYAAGVLGALTFYSYSPAQMVMAVTAAAFFLSDFKYHWQHRKSVLIMLGICAVMALPYVRYLVNHPGENTRHLLILNSYLIKSTPVWEKIATYFKLYWLNLNPSYWFFPNDVDLIRHVMKGYGNLGLWTLPLVVLGLINLISRIKESPYRVVLIALLAAPTGAALTGQGVTRVLFMVIPAALLAGLGIDMAVHWLAKLRVDRRVSAGVCLAALVGLNGYMVYDAVKNAPTWFADYGLSGMQYGAKQVFAAAIDYMDEHPDEKLIISSQWANGSDTLGRYFLTKPYPYAMGSIQAWLDKQLPLDDSYTFVVIPSEMNAIQQSPKFQSIQVLQTIPYPNGQPGFYFVKVAYADDIAEIFAKEVEARHQLTSDIANLPDGTEVIVEHPALDMGSLRDLFDGNPASVVRSAEANPMVLVLQFPNPPSFSSLTVRIGGGATEITISVTPADGSEPINMSQVLPVAGDYRNVTFSFNKEIAIKEIRISIRNTESGEPDHVHVWEITLQ